MLAPWKKSCDKPRQHIKKQRHHFANRYPSSLSYGFSRSHVWMWELNYKESWAPKNWCFGKLWCWRRLLRVLWIARRFNQSILKESESEVAQSCPTLCGPMDCSLSGSSVHGIFQARVLEWIAISFSRGSSRPRNQTQVSCIAGRRFTIWATREAHCKGSQS